jgi:chromosomal replication initiation ATPase DnaA
LILLSREPLDHFEFDEHVRSRLIPGNGFEISPPEESDMPKLIDTIARQRGISLKDRKIDFIVRRLGRDIGALERYFDRVRHLADVLGQSVRFPVLGDAL